MDVLSRMVRAGAPGGAVLDLQVIRPGPRVEVDGRVLCALGGETLLARADAATAAVDARIEAGDLVEEAVDDHDVLRHHRDGPSLLEHWSEKERRVPPACAARLQTLARPCVVRERCRLRRLRIRVR